MNSLERVLGYPFFYTGVLADKMLNWNNPGSLFFFFPHYHTGGAEQVHLDILRIFADQKPFIIITNNSRNKTHYQAMQDTGRLIEIYKYFNNANRFIVKNFFYGFLASMINRHPKSVVISANSTIFYELCYYLNESYIIDILHGLFGINNKHWIQATPKINKRIVVSQAVYTSVKNIYIDNGFADKYDDRLKIIHNAVPMCDLNIAKDLNAPLKIVFIARNSKEKRFHLYQQIALKVIQELPGTIFYCIGNYDNTQPIVNLGEICDRQKLYQTIKDFHILILCSISEGFGLVISEGMTCGLVPLATDVGGVRETFQDGISGFLIKAENEEEIIAEFIADIKKLDTNRELLKLMSNSAREYVQENINYERFKAEYTKVVEEGKNR
ncbi:MAG: glycosyltransferase family 4 protein [Candidatus Cloacimonas sp.]|nr:glycosyltransferase family 4 protein [Candidatus Cloacimonas sp.]